MQPELDRTGIRSLHSQIRRIVLAMLALSLPIVLVLSAGYAAPGDENPIPLPAFAADYNYIGASACGICHRSPAKGNQLGQWQGSRHSKAYERLATAEAKAAGAKVGVTDPQKSEKCLTCHVTAYDLPAARKAATWKMEDGVACESCHGPGSAYKSMAIMRDHDQSVANGLVIPTRETCVTCHNERNPTHTGFDFEEAYKKIAHPNPAK